MDVPVYLLAVGGPRHGDWLPYRTGDYDIRVAVMLPLSAVFGDDNELAAGASASFTSATYERRLMSRTWVWVHVG